MTTASPIRRRALSIGCLAHVVQDGMTATVYVLLPLLAIFATSIRPGADINRGNVFGWPSDFTIIENYTAVFVQS